MSGHEVAVAELSSLSSNRVNLSLLFTRFFVAVVVVNIVLMLNGFRANFKILNY